MIKIYKFLFVNRLTYLNFFIIIYISIIIMIKNVVKNWEYEK